MKMVTMIMIILVMISIKIPSLDKPRDTYMEVHPPAYQRARHTQLQRIRMVMVMMMTVNRKMMGIRL